MSRSDRCTSDAHHRCSKNRDGDFHLTGGRDVANLTKGPGPESADIPDADLPRFSDLPLVEGTEERHAWDVWGRKDEIGTMNFIGPPEIRAASALVEEGRVISLSAPLNEPAPGLFPTRTAYTHVVERRSHGRDDRIDGLWLQFSSQWDSLRHVKFKGKYWGGRSDEDVDGENALGIERWAARGIIGRGVLVDAERFFVETGRGMPPQERTAITPEDLEEILAFEGVVSRPGDLVLIRTGWLGWYRGLGETERAALSGSVGRDPDPFACPGLDAGPATAAWLWDHRVAGTVSDNPALEALPVLREIGFLHYRLIPLLGMAVGELWDLDPLAEYCAARGRYEFLCSSGPLFVPGGVGSPSNAYAIF
jgi:hypothetical protein